MKREMAQERSILFIQVIATIWEWEVGWWTLHRIVRDTCIKDQKDQSFADAQRLDIVESLDTINCTLLGITGNPFDIEAEVQLNIVTLGLDPPYDTGGSMKRYQERGFDDIRVERIGKYQPNECKIVSSPRTK